MAVKVIKRKEVVPTEMAKEKARTCCYARVSTLDQSDSYEEQCAHYQRVIGENPDLILTGVYADEGVSGTSILHRDGFNQMMADAEEHKFDQIFTKSISRFGRNTVNTLNGIRHLRELGIGVYFEKENIWTLDGAGEILVTILASLSQAESQSISENVKWGIRSRFQEGRHFVNCSRFLGYDKVNGNLVINPSEAHTVRRIYSLFLNGHSVDMIASTLTKEAIPTATGKTTWYPTNVRYLLSNEKYAGDLRLQKTVVPNFLTHKSKRNTGEADQFYVENAHEPIVPKEVWELAQIENARRSALRLNSAGGRTGGVKYGSRRALAGRCRCSCGAVLHQKRGKYTRWFCPECGFAISEGRLQAAVLDSFRKLVLEEGNLRILLDRAERALAINPHTDDSHTEPEGQTAPWKGGKEEGAVQIIKGSECDDEMTEEERAALLFNRFQIMAALDWIENQDKTSLGEIGDTCYTLKQFIDVTRPGRLDGWNDETILRFIEGVDVSSTGVNVRFKAGVTVTGEVPEKSTTL